MTAHEATARDDELIGELVDLIASGPTPAAVSERIAGRIAASRDCDVLVMRRDSDTWIGAEPVVRDASRRRAGRVLLDRMRTIPWQCQRPAHHERRTGTEAEALDAAAQLADLVLRIDELLALPPEQTPPADEAWNAMVFAVPVELGGPLILVALRSEQEDRAFNEQDRAGIEGTLRAFSPALLSATLAERLDRAFAERDAVLRMVRAIGLGRTRLDRIKVACRTVQLLLVCDYVAITSWDTDPPAICFDAGRIATGPVTLTRKGTVTDVRRHDDPRIITDFPNVPPLDIESYPLHVAEELSASVTFGLRWSGRTFGSLIIGYRRPRNFAESDIRFAESMAHAIMASLRAELGGRGRA